MKKALKKVKAKKITKKAPKTPVWNQSGDPTWGEEDEFYSKKEPAIEASIVENVLSERNLSGFMSKAEVDALTKTGTVVGKTELGTVRIEGEVTPAKLKMAKDFDRIFQESVGEVMDLAAYTPDPDTLDFVKKQGLSQSKIDEIKNAPAWTTFNIGGENLMKTQDNKLENVKNYCYRLERAVLGQINSRKQAVAIVEEALKLKTQELEKITEAYRKTLIGYQSQIRDLTENPLKSVTARLSDTHLGFGLLEPIQNAGLKLKEIYASIKNTLLKLISK